MNIDASPPALAAHPAGLQAGYGLSFSDLGHFERALHAAQTRLDAQPVRAPDPALEVMARPLEYVNNEATTLAEDAHGVLAAGSAVTPAAMVALTVRCQEFMFHCQLTSNVANRASDGVQQLFRQQS